MADVKTITIENVTYNIKDASARATATTANDTANTAAAGVTSLDTRVTALETASANHVTLDSAQTITGSKTFTSIITTKHTGMDDTVNPTENKYTGYRIADKNDHPVSYLSTKQDTEGKITTRILGSRTINGTLVYTDELGMVQNTDGTSYTICPTPAVSSNTNAIATTSYINNKFKVAAALPAVPDANIFYFIPE